MANPIKIAKGIESLLKKTANRMREGKTGQFIGKSRSEASFGKKHRYSDWDRYKQTAHVGTDLPYSKRSPMQKAARDLLQKAIKTVQPNIADSTAHTYAQNMLTELRRAQQAAIEARKLNRFREAAEWELRAKEANSVITDIMKKVTALATVPAVAKMTEATMMPEESFGTKAGNLLIDIVSPIPRYK